MTAREEAGRIADVLMVRHVDEFWCDPGHHQSPPNRLMHKEIVEALIAAREAARVEGMETTAEERAELLAQAKDPRAMNDLDVGLVERVIRDADKAAGLAALLAAEKRRVAQLETILSLAVGLKTAAEARAEKAEDNWNAAEAECAEASDLILEARARAEKAEAALRVAADNLTEASRAVERAANADPQTIARLAFHVQKMAVAARAALGGTP